MSKFTKGPWRISRPSVVNGVQVLKDWDYPNRSDVICTMPKEGEGRTANAHLIAAAPDIYEALEFVAQFIDDYFIGDEDSGEPQKTKLVVMKALKKAKGE